MSEEPGNRAERMARYKEDRRRQLASQFGALAESPKRQPAGQKDISSSSEEVRTTRASRLRAAASVQETPSGSSVLRMDKEKSAASLSNSSDFQRISKVERDKSGKRKSNLNRALNSEAVPDCDSTDDLLNRRRRRRFFPPEVLQQALDVSPNDESRSDNFTASSILLNTASPTARPKKSELSIHMENARRGHLVSYSDMGKSSRASPKKKEKSPKPADVSSSSDSSAKLANKENIKGVVKAPAKKSINGCESDPAVPKRKSTAVAKRMDDLTALTKETLARVERLTNKTRDSPKRDLKVTATTSNRTRLSDSPVKVSRLDVKLDSKAETRVPLLCDPRKLTHSILKKKSLEEPVEISINFPVVRNAPVSILKRKVSQDEFRLLGPTSSNTPPVTFSPSVVDPATNRKKQGILKKRRSLDEAQVLRHRSYSPEGALSMKSDSKSILKSQRRSSLEELVRTQSPDLHGILKRRTSRNEDDADPPINSPEPHGILKRRSGTSSAGSNVNSPHVSIATAVILAAARGAEIVLESGETVKPILKKKSFSDEHSHGENTPTEAPKPILKKKSSTDTEDYEDRPKPILKNTRNSMEDKESDFSEVSYSIRKQSGSRENSPRPRLSFCADEHVTYRRGRRSHTICGDSNVAEGQSFETDENEQKERPISVCDMVLNFEKRLSTGAVPKKSNPKRHSERYRTQPITYDELEASLNSVHSSFQQDLPTSNILLSSPILQSGEAVGHNAHSLLDLSFYETESNLINLLSSSLPNTTLDSGISGKMSSDSAFQSLGDGLELENDEKPLPPTPPKTIDKFEPAKLQMKALAEEARNLQLRKGGGLGLKSKLRKSDPSDRQSSSSRFSTQPITVDEVEEASKLKKEPDCINIVDVEYRLEERDPARLSLSDRIKLFNDSTTAEEALYKPVPKARLTRFQTQPVTLEEVEFAKLPSHRRQKIYILDSSADETPQKERKGILKSKSGTADSLKSVLKKNDSAKYESSGLRSILKSETLDFARDEGISSDDSASSSEPESGSKLIGFEKGTGGDCVSISARLAKIASENSRMGRYADKRKTETKSSSEDTTDADSSGGREVRSIIGGATSRKRARERLSNEGLILKSKSHGLVCGDEEQEHGAGVRRSLTQATMPKSIAELQAKLQKSGDSDWRKRIPKLNSANEELSVLNVKNIYNEELTEKTSILAVRKDELDAASRQWKNRVEQSDAINFSVAGRMLYETNDVPIINIPTPDKTKKTPKAKAYKGREGGDVYSETLSTPVSPEKSISSFKRSISLPGSGDDTSTTSSETSLKTCTRRVQVERPDDVTFTSFFQSVDSKRKSDIVEVSLDDLDSVVRQTEDLLVQKRTVKVQKRREPTKNPVKALAARPDIKNEYTEIITGIAEREKQRLNIEKLAKTSNYAVEALAGLASKEDFSSVALKRSSSLNANFPPFKDLMLLQVKGRRFVQTRLVEPAISSVNDGDCFILVTPNALFQYIGAYSNIIEQSRAADIVSSIQQTNDLGCKTDKVISINGKKLGGVSSNDLAKFWKLLGSAEGTEVAAAGHPDEDEVYESSILGTNMIYVYSNEQLVPLDSYWGGMPKIEMLSPLKTFVFDFGSEMYVWSGKNAVLDDKKKALNLARELWNEGFNYTECGISPLGIAKRLGSRQNPSPVLNDAERPNWSMFARITQHRETVLFKEKFLDWPDYSRVIKVKQDDSDKTVDAKYDFQPCNIGKLLKANNPEPDLEIDGVHLGRGQTFFDEETNRLFTFTTKSVTSWVILEYSHEQLSDESVRHFHEGNSYIIRWEFFANITGRELSGKPSKYVQAGRDHCVYFCWQGRDATVNEKGAAALLTITLDSENARQIRIMQGAEPPAFLNLFKGGMVVHRGKHEKLNKESCRLYICKGEKDCETALIEVPCSMRSLRSCASFVLVNLKSGTLTVWYGCKASSQTKNLAKSVADKILAKPSAFGFNECFNLTSVEEGIESKDFFSALGGEKRQLYLTLLKNNRKFDHTPRLFYLSSLSGMFEASEVLCPHRSEYVTPYPVLQSDLYSASQPALFMLDNRHEVWLWQGWWPERDDDLALVDQTGSGAIRWQEERKVAMQTAVDYCKERNEQRQVPIYLVWAGLEPLAFTNLFPFWRDRDDIAEINMQEGKKAGEAIILEKELALLTRSTYPVEQLLQRPLPDGVDPTHLENYLSQEDFKELMLMTLDEFQKLPPWKQTAIKKEKGLF